MTNADLPDAAWQALPILDPRPLEDAFGSFSQDTVEALRFFLSSTRPLLERVRADLAAGRHAEAAEAAHSAKGAANMTGAFRLGSLCAQIDQALRGGDEARASRLVAVLAPVFAEVEATVERQAAALSSS